jgi:DNA topoisomerase-1
MQNIIVIESPNKIKKLRELTGFATYATVGHFKDLPQKELGVDLKTYEPVFVLDAQKKNNITKIKQAARGNRVYIATDPDREGYAIGTMVYEEVRKLAAECLRLEITEITERGVREAMGRAVSFDRTNRGLYDAFLGRRVGDRLVGYILSPEASRAIPHERGTSYSVGRVQSPAVRLVVDREREIRAFKPAPFWILSIELEKGVKFTATYQGGRFDAKAGAEAIVSRIQAAATATAEKVEKKDVVQRPRPPFTTVDMQAAASAQLGLAPERSMQLAQGLFESGLISYHRTDSTRLAPEWVQEARAFIASNIGPEYVPAAPQTYKSKNSQAEAHEAIRPAHVHAYADTAAIIGKEGLSQDHQRLYELIYRRAVASQMASAIYAGVLYIFDCSGEKFKSTGRTLKFPGFLKLWEDSEEEKNIDKSKIEDGDANQILPEITQGESVPKTGEKLEEKTTKPPRRYTEAALVKELEKRGIGRPSTYASICKTIKFRGYVRVENKALVPGPSGENLVDHLMRSRAWVIDYSFTANMEQYLDQVEQHEQGETWQLFVKSLHGKLDFIDPGQAQSGQQTLSEKQIAIIEKHASKEMKERILKGDIVSGRKFLDAFFRKIKRGKK